MYIYSMFLYIGFIIELIIGLSFLFIRIFKSGKYTRNI